MLSRLVRNEESFMSMGKYIREHNFGQRLQFRGRGEANRSSTQQNAYLVRPEGSYPIGFDRSSGMGTKSTKLVAPKIAPKASKGGDVQVPQETLLASHAFTCQYANARYIPTKSKSKSNCISESTGPIQGQLLTRRAIARKCHRAFTPSILTTTTV